MSVCGQRFVCPDCVQDRPVRESVVLTDTVTTWRSCAECARVALERYPEVRLAPSDVPITTSL